MSKDRTQGQRTEFPELDHMTGQMDGIGQDTSTDYRIGRTGQHDWTEVWHRTGHRDREQDWQNRTT